MNFDVFEKKAKELGVLGIVVTKDGKEIGKRTEEAKRGRANPGAARSLP